MKKRYMPTIVANGRTYENVAYSCLADAMDALKEFIQIFKGYNDSKIEKVFVRNIITGKCIFP